MKAVVYWLSPGRSVAITNPDHQKVAGKEFKPASASLSSSYPIPAVPKKTRAICIHGQICRQPLTASLLRPQQRFSSPFARMFLPISPIEDPPRFQ
jgi:hypothetical protein